MTHFRLYARFTTYCRLHFGPLRWARKADAAQLASGIDVALTKGHKNDAHRLEIIFMRKADATYADVSRDIGLREVRAGRYGAALPLLDLAYGHGALRSATEFQSLGYAHLHGGSALKAYTVLQDGARHLTDAALSGEVGNAALMQALTHNNGDAQQFEQWRNAALGWYFHGIDLAGTSQTDTTLLKQNARVAAAIKIGVVYGVSAGLKELPPPQAGRTTGVKKAVLGAIQAGACYTTRSTILMPTYFNGTMMMLPQATVKHHRRPLNDALAAQISAL
jgi:hypothetical protein